MKINRWPIACLLVALLLAVVFGPSLFYAWVIRDTAINRIARGPFKSGTPIQDIEIGSHPDLELVDTDDFSYPEFAPVKLSGDEELRLYRCASYQFDLWVWIGKTSQKVKRSVLCDMNTRPEGLEPLP